MKRVVYPGSFDPWHAGHDDVFDKARKVFDHIDIVVAVNPAKKADYLSIAQELAAYFNGIRNVSVHMHEGFLIDWINNSKTPIDAIVRGLRNGQDLENERVQQYWNEDLAKERKNILLPPTVYFVTDRNLVHISSSAIRAVEKIRGK